jgi:catechol 2,3-dioxygenase-like lactoylglutathione lyase family enzyme
VTIDHVELFVPDRYAAAQWYERALGLAILSEYESWASDARGPLMISGDGGATKLALFEGSPPPRPDSGFRRVAFRLDAPSFVEAIRRLSDLQVRDSRGRPVDTEALVDHGKAFSVYFSDPYGHLLEITTYDHAAVVEAIATG